LEKSRLLLYALLALAVLNISTASILVRLAGVHGFVAATWRLILSALITWLLLALTRQPPPRPPPRDLALMTASGAALALHFGLWMMSLFHLSVAVSVTIVDSYPALLAIAGVVLYGERPTRLQAAGAIAAIAGVGLLAWYSAGAGRAPEGGDPVLGSLLAFAGMLAVATYFIIGKRMRSEYTTLQYTGIVYSVAALVSAGITMTMGLPLTGYPPRTYLLLALLALLPMIGGHTVINYALSRLSLLAATIPILGEPVGAALLAWLILGEPVTPVEAGLMALVIVGLAMVLWGEEARQG